MTNLERTTKIWENTMGQKMPYQLELYLRFHFKKSHQTVDALCTINEEKLINSYLYDTEHLYCSTDPDIPELPIYERAKWYAHLDMCMLNAFKERTKWNS